MSPERYREEVKALAQQDPTNLYLPTLRQKHDAASEVYLAAAWRLLEAKKLEPATPLSIASMPLEAKPLEVRTLMARKGHVNRQQRRVKATVLMTATSDAERKASMRQLAEMQAEWATIDRQIRVWEMSGALPEVQQLAQEMSMSERLERLVTLDDLALAAHLQVCRVTVSKKKQQIEKLDPSVLNPQNEKYAHWQKLEQQLAQAEAVKLQVESEVNKRKNGKKE